MQAPLELQKGFFSTPPDPENCFPSLNMQKRGAASYIIDSLGTLKNLLNAKQAANEKPDLRFLVTLSGQIWFARESHEGQERAPAHYQMTGESQSSAQCKTAGNLILNKKYTKLLKINHKSGDFRPTFDSIKWFLAILILNEEKLPFTLPEILLIEEMDTAGKVIQKHRCPVAKLKAWTETLKEDEGLVKMLSKQDLESKKVSYIENLRRLSSSGQSSQSKSTSPLPYPIRPTLPHFGSGRAHQSLFGMAPPKPDNPHCDTSSLPGTEDFSKHSEGAW